ncbi:MAG: oligosaccharide flippase family protein [Gammaproteobacteria bacterium]|nr:oligosaccharide flippase family protein [Gammaproteobacteria bacterium]
MGRAPFRVIKRQFGFVKVRDRGLADKTSQLTALFASLKIWISPGPVDASSPTVGLPPRQVECDSRYAMAHIISSLAWSAVIRILGVGTAFLVNVVLTRLLSVEDVGQYMLAFSTVMFASIVMRLGIKQATMKLASDARNQGDQRVLRQTLLGVMRFGVITTGIVAVVLISGIADWVFVDVFDAPELADFSAWIVAWAAMISLAAPIGESLRALHRPGWGVALDMSAQSSFVFLVLWGAAFYYHNVSLQLVIKIWFFIALMVNLGGCVRLARLIGFAGASFAEWISVASVFHFAWPILILNLSIFLMANAALWVVSYFVGHDGAALYGIALKLYNLIALPLLIINLALEPHIADYIHAGSKTRLEALLRLSASLAFSLTALISIVLIFAGKWILELAFGQSYIAAYPILVILIMGNVFNVLTGSCSSVLLLGGRRIWLSAVNAVAACAGIILALLLVPRWGGVGAALSTATVVVGANAVMWWIVKKEFGVSSAASLVPWNHYTFLKRGEVAR